MFRWLEKLVMWRREKRPSDATSQVSELFTSLQELGSSASKVKLSPAETVSRVFKRGRSSTDDQTREGDFIRRTTECGLSTWRKALKKDSQEIYDEFKTQKLGMFRSQIGTLQSHGFKLFCYAADDSHVSLCCADCDETPEEKGICKPQNSGVCPLLEEACSKEPTLLSTLFELDPTELLLLRKTRHSDNKDKDMLK